MKEHFRIDGRPWTYYPTPDIKLILEKIHRQLEANNHAGAKIVISHCLEKLNNGESLCDTK